MNIQTQCPPTWKLVYFQGGCCHTISHVYTYRPICAREITSKGGACMFLDIKRETLRKRRPLVSGAYVHAVVNARKVYGFKANTPL